MSDLVASFPTSFLTLLALLVALLALAWFSRQVSLHIQLFVYHLTHSADMPTVVLFLILLPGVLVHEAAHWLTARLLGLKTSKFRVWPRKSGRHIGMGSVSVQRGGIWLDSLVGLAPLIVGTFLITLIGQRIFHTYRIAGAVIQGDWLDGLNAFWTALGTTDGTLWAYLLFAIGNAMMPSASDRETVMPVLLFAVLAVIFYGVVGLPLAPLASALTWLEPALQDLSSALLFTIVLDALILVVLFVFELLLHLGADSTAA